MPMLVGARRDDDDARKRLNFDRGLRVDLTLWHAGPDFLYHAKG